jgi:hypothetical protein
MKQKKSIPEKGKPAAKSRARRRRGGRHHAPVSVLSLVTPLCGWRQQQAALDTQAPIPIHARATCTGRSKRSSTLGGQSGIQSTPGSEHGTGAPESKRPTELLTCTERAAGRAEDRDRAVVDGIFSSPMYSLLSAGEEEFRWVPLPERGGDETRSSSSRLG